jgi:aminopeptidase N
MPDSSPAVATHLSDYRPPDHAILRVELDVYLDPIETIVSSRLAISPRSSEPLVLQGEGLKLRSLAIDGVALESAQSVHGNDTLTITCLPDRKFVLSITQSCNPTANTALSGLYRSNGMFCTQMEAEGFRRFAFMYDRPDTMATYRVRLEASKSVPVLLSNGNLIEVGNVDGSDRHFAIWDDPHPKPTYLFALVGGDLASVKDTFTTMSGRQVELGVYVEKGKEDRCAWAMQSLKSCMRWDETRFGREYDLDVFNIVAVSDFNMGAMENKGLNIFNDKYVLARPDTATDTDYVNIEAIIAHEYFHNWTGNRITCRDWFQLCLKEGLTVFRDQEFTSDIRSRPVKRIADVRTLRARQFPEDQGPLAHPVRPTSYIEINNFYTPTVYEKGAEICRMMSTLIGVDAFRKGMDLYFARHDGEAATVEQFVACMADVSGRDLSQFFRWYEQAGTPKVTVRSVHDTSSQMLTLKITQHTSPTPGQPDKVPLHIPLVVGLVDQGGNEGPFAPEFRQVTGGHLIELTEEEMVLAIPNMPERPAISINRGFSAPVAVQTDAPLSDLLLLMRHDRDPFNRWEAAQTLGRSLAIETIKQGRVPPQVQDFADALEDVLTSSALDDAFKAMMLTLPPDAEIAASFGGDADADKVCASRELVKKSIAAQIEPMLFDACQKTGETHPYQPDPQSTARRSLRYSVMSLIAASSPLRTLTLAQAELLAPHSMTAEIGALTAILPISGPEREGMLDDFYVRHKHDHLLVDKWFMLQATVPGHTASDRVKRLMHHADFRITTPNRVYALLAGFTGGNLSGFHAADGSGYNVIADAICTLDEINPQVAARLATGFRSWEIFDLQRRTSASEAMQRILSKNELSRDVFEIIHKIANRSKS